MIATITLTSAGSDSGPYNLYSDIDGYTVAFETGVSKSALLAGFTSVNVPNGTNFIKVLSTGLCTNYILIPLVYTTTTTTTLPDPETSILTFSSYEAGLFTFTLSNPIYSTNIKIIGAQVDGSTTQGDCTIIDAYDLITSLNPAELAPGATTVSQIGTSPFACDVISAKKLDNITIAGYGTFIDGDTVVIGGTLVTISIPAVCEGYICSEFRTWNNVKTSNTFLTICSESPITVYTDFEETITTGVIVYTDSLLTTPLLEKAYIVDPLTNGIFNINSTTGLIESFEGSFCI
jgi:hypothetical protein